MVAKPCIRRERVVRLRYMLHYVITSSVIYICSRPQTNGSNSRSSVAAVTFLCAYHIRVVLLLYVQSDAQVLLAHSVVLAAIQKLPDGFNLGTRDVARYAVES